VLHLGGSLRFAELPEQLGENPTAYDSYLVRVRDAVRRVDLTLRQDWPSRALRAR
jgi:hypothetical protein